MAPKRKLKQISNYDEKSNRSSKSNSNEEEKNRKKENEEDRYYRRSKGCIRIKPKTNFI